MKKRYLLICSLVLALAAMLAGACGGQKSVDDLLQENGATVKITLDLAGGTSNDKTERYLFLHENTPLALPWEEYGGQGIINPPTNENGYRLYGFFHGTKDEEGNITYGSPWDRSERFSEDTTLYARWVPNYMYRILDENGTKLKDFKVNAGQTLDMSDRGAASVPDKTFIAYYRDKELTIPWDENFIHPGLPEGKDELTAPEEDFVVTVYAKYVDGVYTKVRTVNDFGSSTNYWLIGDENGVLDFEGKDFPVIRQFKGKIAGNGVTIKNATIVRENAFDESYGLFGVLDGATISDVKFENCSYTVKFTRRPQGVSTVKIGFLAATAKDTTLENVTFDNCSLTIEIANRVVPYECDDSETCYWIDRSEDESNHNALTNVSGSIQLNII